MMTWLSCSRRPRIARGHPSKARQWWEDAVNSNELIGLADPAIFGFLRISTNPRLIRPPLSADEAARHVETWLELPNVRWAQPGPGIMPAPSRTSALPGPLAISRLTLSSPRSLPATTPPCAPTTATSLVSTTSAGTSRVAWPLQRSASADSELGTGVGETDLYRVHRDEEALGDLRVGQVLGLLGRTQHPVTVSQ